MVKLAVFTASVAVLLVICVPAEGLFNWRRDRGNHGMGFHNRHDKRHHRMGGGEHHDNIRKGMGSHRRSGRHSAHGKGKGERAIGFLERRGRDWEDDGLSFHELMRIISSRGFRENLHKTGHKEGEYIWKRHNICKKVTYSKELPDVYEKIPFLFHYTECKWANKTIHCQLTHDKKHLTIHFDCCPGFKRSRHHVGCEKMPTENLLEIAEENGLTQFVKAVETVGLTDKLKTGNLTIFAPANDAFDLDSDLIDSGDGLVLQGDSVVSVDIKDVERTITKFQHSLLSHVIPEARESSSFKDEEVIQTLNPDRSTIRINFYRHPYFHGKLVTANCVPVVKKDVEAANGILFSVEKHLDVVNESLLDVIKKRPELSTLKTMLASANLVAKLQEEGQLTLLAPTDAAFDRLGPKIKKQLLSGDPEFLEKVLQNHLLPNVICSAAIPKKARTRNVLDHKLLVEKSEDKKFFIEGAQVIKADIMTTNGVIHILDDALVPDDAFHFMDLLERKGYTEFLNLIEKAGLTKTFRAYDNVTVFAPTNKAIQNLSADVQAKFDKDKEFLQKVLLYHVSDGITNIGQGNYFGQDSITLISNAEKDITVNYYDSFFFKRNFGLKRTESSAQCVPITHRNMKASDAHINVIEGVMFPPEGTVLDILGSDKRFSKFYSLMKKSGIAEMIESADSTPFTIFAPNDKAFENVDQRTLNALEEDLDTVRYRLARHILKGNFCYGDFDISHGMMQFVPTLSRNYYLITFNDGQMSFGNAKVVQYDRTATNGNVIEIDYPVMLDYLD